MERIQKALEKARAQRQQTAADPMEPEHENKQVPGAAGSRATGLPVHIQYSQTNTVEVPEQVLEKNRVVAALKNHPQRDLFRVLRTKILHRMKKQGINSLAITSPTKKGGKSMVASNLAVSIAMEMNHTVMLVDLDLRNPSIHRYFGFETEQGLSDYLLDGMELPNLLVHPGIERLVILPAGKPVPQSSELLATPRMASLVADITTRYAERIILFDLPPLLHMDDALTFLPQVESSLLVVEEGGNTPAEVEQSLHLLEQANLLGTVYNKAEHIDHSPY
ncbi:MAG TPA: exopolysaccharide biosynthesis protein [Methylothermaceae bacterium]|nr:exopolysaccharide biosynthesis protein [Methylothermaceae bacterium]